MLYFTFFDSAEWPTIGISERFVSEGAYKTQQKIKDDYMQRDQKHKDVCMLNLKVMELNQEIRDSTDLTWKEKYDELEAKYMADSTSLNDIINELRKCLKQ